MAVPAAMRETAKLVSRSLDTDVGGYDAFEQTATDGVDQFAVYGFPCHDEFAADVPGFKADPQALYDRVTTDARWHGETMPTLADVQAFCAQVQIAEVWGTEAGLAELGLNLQAQ